MRRNMWLVYFVKIDYFTGRADLAAFLIKKFYNDVVNLDKVKTTSTPEILVDGHYEIQSFRKNPRLTFSGKASKVHSKVSKLGTNWLKKPSLGRTVFHNSIFEHKNVQVSLQPVVVRAEAVNNYGLAPPWRGLHVLIFFCFCRSAA